MNAEHIVALAHIPRFIRRIFTTFFVFLIQIFSFHLLNVTHWYILIDLSINPPFQLFSLRLTHYFLTILDSHCHPLSVIHNPSTTLTGDWHLGGIHYFIGSEAIASCSRVTDWFPHIVIFTRFINFIRIFKIFSLFNGNLIKSLVCLSHCSSLIYTKF